MSSAADKKTKRSVIRELTDLGPVILDRSFSKEEFMDLADRYPDLQLEREKSGKIIVMTPVKAGSGRRESIVSFHLNLWNYQTKKGETFSASTGIELPDGSIKSPDCAWVSAEKFNQLSPREIEEEFLQLVPDFVTEVRSKSDSLSRLKRKMTDAWIKNGVRLAWLIDPFQEKAYIYREDGTMELVEGFSGKKLSGEEVLPGMELPLEELTVAGKG